MIHSLYSHKDVFLRELLSNANDALEKLRLEALTNRDVLSAGDGNITIAIESDDGNTGRVIIRDTGIGMNRTELAKNLGTIARSGTNEFLATAERTGKADTNLIGQFGEFEARGELTPRPRILLVLPRLAYRPGIVYPARVREGPQPRAAHVRIVGQGRQV